MCAAKQITIKGAFAAHTLSVRPFLQTWPKKWQSASLVTTVVCARLVLLLTMHFVLCTLRVVCAAKSPVEHTIGTSKRCGLTMPHPEEIYGIAVEGGTLFGALPQEKKLPESVTRHFFHCPWRRFVSTSWTRLQRVLSSSSGFLIQRVVLHGRSQLVQ